MKKILFVLLFLPFASIGQSIPVTPVSFGTRADLRLQVGQPNTQVFLNGLVTIGDNNGGSYMWNPTSTATDDGFTVLQVTGVTTGRWLRLVNSNTLKGGSTFSGTGLVSSFNVSYATLPFTPAQVQVQATTANAVSNWVTNLTASGFTINFATIPLLGTNNIGFTWLLIKQ